MYQFLSLGCQAKAPHIHSIFFAFNQPEITQHVNAIGIA